MRNKKRSLRGRIAPLAIAGATLLSGFTPLISNAGVWARPERPDPVGYLEGLLLTLDQIDMKTMLDVDATSDGGFIAAGPFYQHSIDQTGANIDFLIGSSLVKYNANSEVEWTKKISEFNIGGDQEIDEMLDSSGNNHQIIPVIKKDGQSIVFMPGMNDEDEMEFMCIEKNEFMSAFRNERQSQTIPCPDTSVGLTYSIKQSADGGYVGLSGGFSALGDFVNSVMLGADMTDSPLMGILNGLDSSLVKFDANGDKVWSTVVSGEAVSDALVQEFRRQGLIANDDEALMPPMTLVKDLIPLNDGGYITSGVSVAVYGNAIFEERMRVVPMQYAAEEEPEVKAVYTGVLEKFNSEGNLVGVKTYATKALTSSQIRDFAGSRAGISEDLNDYEIIETDEHPEGHFYCRYDYEDHDGDPDYIYRYGYYYTECREDDYFFVRMRDMREYGPRGDDPIKTEEYLNFYREMLTIGGLTLPTQTTPTSDGGVVVAGTELNIGMDIDNLISGTIIKFDNSLNQQWTYKVNDENRRFSGFKDVTETADGGFVAVGAATKATPISTYVVKVDANGNKVWDKLWLDDEVGAIASAAIGVTELTTGQIVVIGANFEDVDFNNLIAIMTAADLEDAEYILNNIGSIDDVFDFNGYILVLDGITGEKALSQSTPKVNSKVTRIANGKLVIINMNNVTSDQTGAPIQLIGDATIVDFSDVLQGGGNNNGNGEDDYSDITVPNTGVSNEIAQVPLILGAITMAAPFVLKMMARARKHGKATSFHK